MDKSGQLVRAAAERQHRHRPGTAALLDAMKPRHGRVLADPGQFRRDCMDRAVRHRRRRREPGCKPRCQRRFRDAHLAAFRIDEEGRRETPAASGAIPRRRAPRSAARRPRRPTSRVRTAADPPRRARRPGCRRLARARSRRSRGSARSAPRPPASRGAADSRRRHRTRDIPGSRRLLRSGTCASGTASARDTPGNWCRSCRPCANRPGTARCGRVASHRCGSHRRGAPAPAQADRRAASGPPGRSSALPATSSGPSVEPPADHARNAARAPLRDRNRPRPARVGGRRAAGRRCACSCSRPGRSNALRPEDSVPSLPGSYFATTA